MPFDGLQGQRGLRRSEDLFGGDFDDVVAVGGVDAVAGFVEAGFGLSDGPGDDPGIGGFGFGFGEDAAGGCSGGDGVQVWGVEGAGGGAGVVVAGGGFGHGVGEDAEGGHVAGVPGGQLLGQCCEEPGECFGFGGFGVGVEESVDLGVTGGGLRRAGGGECVGEVVGYWWGGAGAFPVVVATVGVDGGGDDDDAVGAADFSPFWGGGEFP